MFSIFRCVAHGTNRGLHLIRISMEFLLFALLNLLSIKHNNGMPRRCSGHMKLISTEMHVMFIKLSNTFMINKYVRLVYFSKANNDVLTNVKHFFDESVGLARSNTFFFCAYWFLTTKMQDEYQPTGLRPSGLYLSLGFIWGVIKMCHVYCTSNYMYNSLCH